MNRYLIGIDLGSGGGKVCLLEPETGRHMYHTQEYRTHYPHPGWAEQEPEEWIEAAARLIHVLLDEHRVDPGEIGGVAVSGVTHSPVLLDGSGKVLGRSIHLTDTRSRKEAQNLRREHGDKILKECFNAPGVMWTLPMLQWVAKHDPAVLDSLSTVLFPKDYLKYRLTGSISTDHIDAQGTLFYDPTERRWDEELLALIPLDVSNMPEILEPTTIGGTVSSIGAEWSGLKEGTPVITGTTDTALEVFAAGSRVSGDCTVKLATFGRICVISGKPVHDGIAINYSYLFPELWYPGTGTKSCASSIRWFRDQFCRDITDTEDVFSAMSREAAEAPPGSEGLLFHPYLQGEGSPYNDPDLRGDFLGLTMHHQRKHLIRSVMEGTSFSLRDSLEYLKGSGVPVRTPIKFIGGGTKSGTWVRILAHVLGMDAVIPDATDPSLGAALLAGAGTGVFRSLEEAQDSVTGVREEILTDRETVHMYDDLFRVYSESRVCLTEIDHRLSNFTAEKNRN